MIHFIGMFQASPMENLLTAIAIAILGKEILKTVIKTLNLQKKIPSVCECIKLLKKATYRFFIRLGRF